MREISPAENLSVDEFLAVTNNPAVTALVSRIRNEKKSRTRPRPSAVLIDRSNILLPSHRRGLLDVVAALVDENLFGRSEMCVQFADLLQRALSYLDLPARSVIGDAIYYVEGREIFRWKHAWVRIGEEVVDGNVDVFFENPRVPSSVKVAPYWGPIKNTPPDRRLREAHGENLPADNDVIKIWWPDLVKWLDENIRNGVEHPARPDGE